jgi:hypothetical protein
MRRTARTFAAALAVAVASAAVLTAPRTGAEPAAQAHTTAPPAGAGASPARGQTSPTNLGNDANGNPLRLATKTGHISNYDESKAGAPTLPDPLTFADGRKVKSTADWTKRRGEILKLYETSIYGSVPANAPSVTWSVDEADPKGRSGSALVKRVIGRFGNVPDGPAMRVTLVTPAGAKNRVPVILLINFGGGPPTPPIAGRGPAAPGDPPVADEILARGWGYAMVGYQDIQPDRANAFTDGVIGLTLAPGLSAPASNEWGTIGAWAWATSRIIDYLVTDPQVDGRRIALQGFSRLGKTTLWAAAQDTRVVALFTACSGEMGAALARRDFGETVDDMAQNFPWQFSGAFQQWVGRWNEMPVDAHMLIALVAPRPVFISGGTQDQWADPKGQFLAAQAAAPVYQLLGHKDLHVDTLPAPDEAVTTGAIGWRYHVGPHAVPADDWRAFLAFLAPVFK